jgi:hypothetical protein
MRRKIGSASPARINPEIRWRGERLADQATVECFPGLAGGRDTRPGRPATVTIAEPGLEVVDDLSQAIPVAQRELEVIETYLGALLNHALGEPK